MSTPLWKLAGISPVECNTRMIANPCTPMKYRLNLVAARDILGRICNAPIPLSSRNSVAFQQVVKRAQCSGTWSTGTATYWEVAATSSDGDGAITVRLPKVPAKDPNLRSGDYITYVGTDPYWILSDYLDDKVGTVKWWSLASGSIPDGWAMMDGADNSAGTGDDLTSLMFEFCSKYESIEPPAEEPCYLGACCSGEGPVNLSIDWTNDVTEEVSANLSLSSDGAEITPCSNVFDIPEHVFFTDCVCATGVVSSEILDCTQCSPSGIIFRPILDPLPCTDTAATGITLCCAWGEGPPDDRHQHNITYDPTYTLEEAGDPEEDPESVEFGLNHSPLEPNCPSGEHAHTVTTELHDHRINAHTHDVCSLEEHYHCITSPHTHTFCPSCHCHLGILPHNVTSTHTHEQISHTHGFSDSGHVHGLPLIDLQAGCHQHRMGKPARKTLIPIERVA